MEGGSWSRSPAWRSGRPDASGISAACIWAFKDTSPAWQTISVRTKLGAAPEGNNVTYFPKTNMMATELSNVASDKFAGPHK